MKDRTKKRGWIAPLLGLLSTAATGQEAVTIPHLGERGHVDYREFLAAPDYRAFVIAPGGTWAWQSGHEVVSDALEEALADCRKHTAQRCVPHTLNDRIVFDAARWPALWGPYTTAAELPQRPVGTRRGERFPDLAWRTPDGKVMKLSDLRGKVVVLHFWGSWCRPCQHEMPDLQRLYDIVKDDPDIRLVLLPVRERFTQARRWAEQIGVRMPIYDTGLRDETDELLRLADGSAIPDRKIARTFPTTHVLDKHGVLVFSHVGAASRWLEYAPFLRDAAAKSGR